MEKKEQFTTDGDDKIICPYCLEERKIDPETDYDQEGYEHECGHCEKIYYVSPHISWSWTASQDCELNKEEHNWKTESETNHNIGNISKHANSESIYCECSKCGITKYIDKNCKEGIKG